MDRTSTEVNTHESAQPVYTVKYLEELVTRVRNGNLKIAIYGLGHVGAPLAAVWLRAGASVIGIDKSEKVREYAKEGKPRSLSLTSMRLLPKDFERIDFRSMMTLWLPQKIHFSR